MFLPLVIVEQSIVTVAKNALGLGNYARHLKMAIKSIDSDTAWACIIQGMYCHAKCAISIYVRDIHVCPVTTLLIERFLQTVMLESRIDPRVLIRQGALWCVTAMLLSMWAWLISSNLVTSNRKRLMEPFFRYLFHIKYNILGHGI